MGKIWGVIWTIVKSTVRKWYWAPLYQCCYVSFAWRSLIWYIGSPTIWIYINAFHYHHGPWFMVFNSVLFLIRHSVRFTANTGWIVRLFFRRRSNADNSRLKHRSICSPRLAVCSKCMISYITSIDFDLVPFDHDLWPLEVTWGQNIFSIQSSIHDFLSNVYKHFFSLSYAVFWDIWLQTFHGLTLTFEFWRSPEVIFFLHFESSYI